MSILEDLAQLKNKTSSELEKEEMDTMNNIVTTNSEFFNFLQQFINDVNITNSNLDKQNVILEYYNRNKDLFTTICKYVYDYHLKYYITSSNLLKNKDLFTEDNETLTIYEVLNKLNGRIVTGNSAIKMVNSFINKNKDNEDLIYRIIDRDLKCRIDAKTINKVIPNLIPTFDVSLGEKFDSKRFNWQEEDWYCSRKLDGIRCIYQEKYHNFTSRQGEEFWTLGVLSDAILTIKDKLQGIVLDGELSLINFDGSDDYQGIMKQIRKKNHSIENIRFNVFDILTQEEFDSQTSERKFYERYTQLLELKDILESTGHIKVVLQTKIDSEETFNSLKAKALENEWEGLMLRKDDIYKGKRSFDLLKYKEFSDAEYIVESVEYGVKPMLVNKSMQDVECVTALHIKHKGYDVKVGSGLSDTQRVEWKNNPELIIGKTIKVKYFEETSDQYGNLSLRFPILLMVYENGRFD